MIPLKRERASERKERVRERIRERVGTHDGWKGKREENLIIILFYPKLESTYIAFVENVRNSENGSY